MCSKTASPGTAKRKKNWFLVQVCSWMCNCILHLKGPGGSRGFKVPAFRQNGTWRVGVLHYFVCLSFLFPAIHQAVTVGCQSDTATVFSRRGEWRTGFAAKWTNAEKKNWHIPHIIWWFPLSTCSVYLLCVLDRLPVFRPAIDPAAFYFHHDWMWQLGTEQQPHICGKTHSVATGRPCPAWISQHLIPYLGTLEPCVDTYRTVSYIAWSYWGQERSGGTEALQMFFISGPQGKSVTATPGSLRSAPRGSAAARLSDWTSQRSRTVPEPLLAWTVSCKLW